MERLTNIPMVDGMLQLIQKCIEKEYTVIIDGSTPAFPKLSYFHVSDGKQIRYVQMPIGIHDGGISICYVPSINWGASCNYCNTYLSVPDIACIEESFGIDTLAWIKVTYGSHKKPPKLWKDLDEWLESEKRYIPSCIIIKKQQNNDD